LSVQQDTNEIVDDYRKCLLQKIKKTDITVLSYPEITHQKVVQRDLQRRKPFKENGIGYRDTLIWETVLSLLKEHREEIVFVTNNKRDFGNEPNLFSELLLDIEELGFGAQYVKLYNSLDNLNNELFIPQLKRLNKMMVKLEHDDVEKFSLIKWLQENLLEELKEYGWDYELAELEYGHGTANIESLTIKTTTIDDVRALPSGNLLISSTVQIEGDVEVQLEWEDYLSFSDVRDLLDMIDEITGFEALRTKVPFDSTLAFTLILEGSTNTPISFEVDELDTFRYGIVVNKHPRKPPNPASS
jgi:hypothetical protein